MKIGIIGSAVVGQTLAKAFKAEGHEVVLGTRNAEKEEVVAFIAGNEGIKAGSFADAAAFGEMIVLAAGGEVILHAVELAGAASFSGKVVIDATNPIASEAPQNGVLKFFTSYNESLMERLQAALPEAKLVKAFNSVGAGLMYKPALSAAPSMFICGNDEEAKSRVKNVLTAFGWETEDMGKAEAARAIEPLCILWCIPGFINNQWNHAFKLLKA